MIANYRERLLALLDGTRARADHWRTQGDDSRADREDLVADGMRQALDLLDEIAGEGT
jgi:hypothetical protein